RWRLQLWYGLILVVVLAGLGFTAWQLQRGRQFRRIDEELQRRASELGSALRFPPRRERGLGGPPPGEFSPDRPLPPDPRSLRSGAAGPTPPPGQGPPERPFAEGPPEGFPRPPAEFHLPPQQASLFDEGDTNGFY